MVVEDEDDLREIISGLLQSVGPQVVVAQNGRDALRELENGNFCAVVSDINMPVMSGLELLEAARKQGRDVPFVFVTAYGERNNLLEALRLGAMDFIEKPFDNERLVEVVKKAVEVGTAQLSLEKELDRLSEGTSASSEQIARMRNMRRAALLMKIENEIYCKKKD